MSEFSDDDASPAATATVRLWPFDTVRVEGQTGYEDRFDVPNLTVVHSIAAERTTAALAGVEMPLVERWQALTKPLELAGRNAMRRLPSGGLALTRSIVASMPWLDDLIRSVELQLLTSLAAGRPWLALRPMLLVGPPGAGKSHFARQLATLAGCGSGVLDVGGRSDNRTLEGTARGYSNSQPCWPLTVIAASLTANPVLVLDEIDKVGASPSNGDVKATLLAMLEPSTAAAWFDACLMAPADLSAVNWILTSNSVEGMPCTLVSRLDVHHVGLPEPGHFDAVLAGVLGGIARDLQLRLQDLPELKAPARSLLYKAFRKDRSVRVLARHARTLVGALLADGIEPSRQ